MRFLDYVGAMPPTATVNFLIRSGGRTAIGHPVYRLVQTDKVLEKVGASWDDWGEHIPVEDRGSVVTNEDGTPAAAARPLRTVVEVREVTKYPHLPESTWLLERYMPVPIPEAVWYSEANCVPGTSVPMMGPYPSGGQYIMIAGPFPQIPSDGFLADQIGHWEARRAEIPRDVEQHVKKRVYEAQRREDARRAKFRAEKAAEITDAISFLHSNSAQAGALRTKLAERGGFRSHIGN